jgi:starch phosphorylase
MKFALNGALTIGTYDGANIEICEEVGEDNIFIFGLRAETIEAMRRQGTYQPQAYCKREPALARVMAALRSAQFCPRTPDLFSWFYDALMEKGDYYFHLADLASYIPTQLHAADVYTQPALWAQKAIYNVARIGKFSSDRTIREYASDIWKIQPVLKGRR